MYDLKRRKLLEATDNGDVQGEAAEEETRPVITLKAHFRFLRFLEVFYPGFIVDISILLFAIFVGGFFAIFIYGYDELAEGAAWAVALVVLFTLGFVLSHFVIFAHKKRKLNLAYKMPFVPFVPALSIALNILLLSNLTATTWIRFSVWFFAGKAASINHNCREQYWCFFSFVTAHARYTKNTL